MDTFFDFAFTPQISGTEELYFRSKGFVSENGVMTAEREGAEVSFDTYFNMIPSAKLREYTTAEQIVFSVDGSEIDVEILGFDGKENISLGSKSKYDINDIPEEVQYIYPVVSAKCCKAVLRGISVMLSGEVTDTSAALIICTYKREDYLIPNLNYIIDELEKKSLDIRVIVIDNAKNIAPEKIPDNVILIPNDNTGGSGGFGRGMAAAAEMNRFTHFILMDDDVKLDFVSLQKLLGFLHFRNGKHKDISVSGSMLYINEPNVQFESGGRFSADGSQSGFGHYLDMTAAENLYKNEMPKDMNYGGWWLMCIPMKYVYDGNYPMPFFIKYDDVEYALRCKLEIITLNGVSVWHEPFEWKYNSSSEYYNMRNFLHLRSLTDSGFTKRQAKKIVRKQMLEKYCRQQYKMAEAVRLGYEDFLKGIEYLSQLDPEENHRRICSLNYEMLSSDDLYQKYGIRFSEDKYVKSQRANYRWYMKPFLYGLLIPGIFCKKDYAVVDAFFDRKEMYFLYKKVFHINRYLNIGYVTYKKRKGDF